jgi:3-phenylpropionate/trans-cinnamate dioxygenase ferredoxin reductase component
MTREVLIVGGGLGAQRAAETLRRRGHDGPIRMLCAEPVAPYDRPPLSKQVLREGGEHERVALRPAAWYAEHDVDLLLGLPAVGLDLGRRRVLTVGGDAPAADAVLIATGAQARRLPVLSPFANVHTLRSLADAQALRGAIAPGRRLAVVGAGFIGQEVAATARGLGAEVTLIEAMAQPLEHVVGARLGAWFARLHRAHGVEVLLGDAVASAHGNGSVQRLRLAGGREVDVDAVVVGVGVQPAAGWLRGTPLGDGPIAVDARGRTAVPGVFAAGDVAAAPGRDGRRERCEHWESAARGAVAAAHGILGLDPPPAAVPAFWSDLYDSRVQLVGRAADAEAVTVEGDQESPAFVASFTRSGRPVAALLVNRAAELPHRRRLLAGDSDPPSTEGGLAA